MEVDAVENLLQYLNQFKGDDWLTTRLNTFEGEYLIELIKDDLERREFPYGR